MVGSRGAEKALSATTETHPLGCTLTHEVLKCLGNRTPMGAGGGIHPTPPTTALHYWTADCTALVIQLT